MKKFLFLTFVLSIFILAGCVSKPQANVNQPGDAQIKNLSASYLQISSRAIKESKISVTNTGQVSGEFTDKKNNPPIQKNYSKQLSAEELANFKKLVLKADVFNLLDRYVCEGDEINCPPDSPSDSLQFNIDGQTKSIIVENHAIPPNLQDILSWFFNQANEFITTPPPLAPNEQVPLAPNDVWNWSSNQNYLYQRFRFQGCLEPHKCTGLAPETCVINKAGIKLGCINHECDINHLGNCCDCIRMGNYCPIVAIENVAKEKLTEIRKTNETKYNVEVMGIVTSGSRMRPIQIQAEDLKILGECPTQK